MTLSTPSPAHYVHDAKLEGFRAQVNCSLRSSNAISGSRLDMCVVRYLLSGTLYCFSWRYILPVSMQCSLTHLHTNRHQGITWGTKVLRTTKGTTTKEWRTHRRSLPSLLLDRPLSASPPPSVSTAACSTSPAVDWIIIRQLSALATEWDPPRRLRALWCLVSPPPGAPDCVHAAGQASSCQRWSGRLSYGCL